MPSPNVIAAMNVLRVLNHDELSEILPFYNNLLKLNRRIEASVVMADVTPTIPGYFTRDGRMVEFFRDNPDKSDYCRLKVWRLLPGREEIYTSPEGQMDTADPNYLANGHPLDIMLPQVAQVAR